MGYRWKALDKPVLMTVQRPLRIEFGIHQRKQSCISFIISGPLITVDPATEKAVIVGVVSWGAGK